MNVFGLLAEQTRAWPALEALDWHISGSVASAHLEELGGTYLRPSGKGPNMTMVVVKPPATLPVIARLGESGWRCFGRTARSAPLWELTAEVGDGHAMVRVQGYQATLPDGTGWQEADPHSHACYFSPPPPPLGSGKKAMALSREWQDRVTRHDWAGWTATEPPVTPGQMAELARSAWPGEEAADGA